MANLLPCDGAHTTHQVDAPRWGKENMVIDNLDDIEPCRVDCDKDGGSTGEDFAFFGNMLALNVHALTNPYTLKPEPPAPAAVRTCEHTRTDS